MITRKNYEIWMLDYAEGKLDAAQQKLFLAFLEQNPDLKKELEAFDQVSLNTDSQNETLSKHNLKKYHSWLLDKYTREELVFHYNEGNLTAEELREWNDLVKTMPVLLQQAQKEKQFVLKPRLTEKFGEKNLLKREEAIYEITEENHATYFIQYHETRELALHKAITGFLAQHPELKTSFEQYGQLYLRPDLSVIFAEKSSLKKKEKVVAFYWWRYAAAAAAVILAVWFLYPNEESKTPQQAQSDKNKIQESEQSIPQQNTVSPHNVIAEDQDHQEQNKTQQVPANYARKQEHHEQKQEKQNDKNQHLPVEDKKSPGDNFVRNEHKQPEDSVVTPPSPLQKEEHPLANNTGNGNKGSLHGNDHIQTVENPAELVSAVVNKKYYESETPRQQTSSTFYAMRNVVHTVSGGQADLDKKEDKNSKEFSIRIGNFGFSRKKHKADD